jgi:hypothetical protein
VGYRNKNALDCQIEAVSCVGRMNPFLSMPSFIFSELLLRTITTSA